MDLPRRGSLEAPLQAVIAKIGLKPFEELNVALWLSLNFYD